MSVVFSPDGTSLLSSDTGGHVFSWETEPLSSAHRLARRQSAQNARRLVSLVETGMAHFAAQEWQAAIEDFTAALRLEPEGITTRFGRACAYAQLQRWSEARKDAEKSFEPSYLPCLLYLAQGDGAGYRRACDAAVVRRDSALPNVATDIGDACALGPGGLRDYTRVLTLIRKQCALHPDDEYVRLLLGELQYRAGQFPEAVRTLNTCKTLDTASRRLLTLAMAQQKSGNHAAAYETLSAAEKAVHAEEQSNDLYAWPYKLLAQIWLKEAKSLILPNSPSKRGAG